MPASDSNLDERLEAIADNCTHLHYVADASVAGGTLVSALTVLSTTVLTTGDGNGHYSIANYSGALGDGRGLTVAAMNVAAIASGTSKGWALSDGTTVVTSDTHADKVMQAGQTYECPAFLAAVELDPVSVVE